MIIPTLNVFRSLRKNDAYVTDFVGGQWERFVIFIYFYRLQYCNI